MAQTKLTVKQRAEAGSSVSTIALPTTATPSIQQTKPKTAAGKMPPKLMKNVTRRYRTGTRALNEIRRYMKYYGWNIPGSESKCEPC